VAGVQASEASDTAPAPTNAAADNVSRWSWTSVHDKDILALALPAALALAADPLLGMVDTALVGRLGADELVSSMGT
jgi:Na+-driven multidrug efflux pump